MTERFRVGTRRSPLARVQTAWVLARLARAAPGVRFEPVAVDTSGDRDRPVGLDPRLSLLACPRRVDPRDCLVIAPEHRASPLPRGARVGSSSLRRRAQLLRWRPDVRVVEVRGNVETRIGLVRSGTIDAAILAVAGLSRLGRAGEIGRILPPTSFLPAPAQGALAVVARASDSTLASLVRRFEHTATHRCVTAERTFAAALGGDCRVPLGALATHQDRTVSLVGEVLTTDGRRRLRRHRRGPASDAEAIGSRLGTAMLDEGALELMPLSRS